MTCPKIYMYQLRYLLIGWIVILLSATHGLGETSFAKTKFDSNELIEKAESQYRKGNYENSKKFVEILSQNESLLDDDEKTRYLVLNIRINAVYQKLSELDRWLEKLFEVEPTFQFDLYSDSPAILERWKLILRKNGRSDQGTKANFLGTGYSEDEMRDRSRFWVGLLPFGIGHFDSADYEGGYFFLGLDLSLFYLMFNDETTINREPISTTGLGLFGLIGAWGYEINDSMSKLYQKDKFKAEEVRYYLSYAPFGVGQAKNGQRGKAIGIGGIQSVFWTMATFSQDNTLSTISAIGAILSYVYGCYDSWVNHSKFRPNTHSGRDQGNLRFQFSPMVDDLKLASHTLTLTLNRNNSPNNSPSPWNSIDETGRSIYSSWSDLPLGIGFSATYSY